MHFQFEPIVDIINDVFIRFILAPSILQYL